MIFLIAPFVRAQAPAPVPVFGWPQTDPGDGAAATLTPIAASSIALAPDGAILYAETGRIRRIDSLGKIHTVVTDSQLDGYDMLAADSAGNVYYADAGPSNVMKWTGSGRPVRIVGGGATPAADGIKATDASPFIAGLAAGPGGLFFSDPVTFTIFRVDSAGILRTVAGTGVSGTAGEGGPAIAAQLGGPGRIGFDALGNLYVEDGTQNGVRWLKIDATGTLTRLGSPPQDETGFSVGHDGSIYYNDVVTQGLSRRAPDGSTAPVKVTSGLGFEGCGPGPFDPHTFAAGELQAVSDSHRLLVLTERPFFGNRQKIVQIESGGAVTLVAGGPDEFSGDGGPASMAGLAIPSAVVADAAGNVFIGDSGNHRVRKVTPDGIIQTVAGTGPVESTLYCAPPKNGYLGQISGVAVDSAGTLYVADQAANRVWRQDSGGQLTAFAGNGQSSTYGAIVGSPATAVPLDNIGQVALDQVQNLWIISGSNGLVKVGASGVILDVVSQISPRSISADPFGTLYVTTNERVYRIDSDDSLVPVAALVANPMALIGPGPPGGVEYPLGIPEFAGPPALTASADQNGTVYFVTTESLETLTPDCVVESSTLSESAYFADATFNPAGGVYISDLNGNRIWQMPPAHTTGQTSVSLGAAPVRSLGSGIVLQNPVSFGAGGDGMGLTDYDFLSDAVAPGELIRISGTCLGPRNTVEAAYDGAGDVPVSLAGTRVLFDGKPAPLLSVVAGEIVAVIPYELAAGSETSMSVVNDKGQARVTLHVAPAVPGLLHRVDSQGADAVIALNRNGTLNSRTAPAAPGTVVALFATGLGQTKPPSQDGMKRGSDRQAAAEVTVEINGVTAPVLYAGPAPGLLGLDQINVKVPATTTGVVSLTAAGITRPQSAVLWVSH